MKPKTPCRCCAGTGIEIDQVRTAVARRKARKAKNLSLEEVSSKMGISIAELSRMESGLRPWTPDRVAEHERICGK